MIVIRTSDEIETIRKAGRIVAEALAGLKAAVRPGVTTKELDAIAREIILKRDGYPAFKGYKAFPGNICTSINEAVVHGIPSARRLKEGDIISLDAGVKFREYYADAAFTCAVGKVSETAQNLMETGEKALHTAIDNVIPGRHLSDVSHIIQEYVESRGFSVVRALVGHGIGRHIHEEPEIPNYGRPGSGPVLKPGMVLAIEPMINAGTFDIEILEDGWTAVTVDRRLSAHFEHTVVVTESGAEILTKI